MTTYELFDKLWYRYDIWYEKNKVTAENEVRAILLLGLRGRGLEVGVGTGYFASKLGIQYGLDPSINMLRIARARGVEVILGFGECLPFKSESFDYVLLIVTLCFVDNPLAILMEAHRVTKRGGLVVTCIIPRDSIWGRYYMRKESPFYKVARFYTVNEVMDMLKSVKLRVVKAVSTLRTYGPEDRPRYEEPVAGDLKGGFICIAAQKVI